MRKTTEELWSKALSISTCSESVTETFRRLVIENERECAEAVADVVHGGLCNRLMWLSEDGQHTVPVGTKLFTFPPAAIDRDAVIEALQLAHDHMRLYLPHYTEKHNVFDTLTRAIKSQPTKTLLISEQISTPDPRDEVIRQQAEALMLAKALLENLTTYDVRPSNIWRSFYAASTGDYVNLREVKEQAKPVLAAIDALPKKGK